MAIDFDKLPSDQQVKILLIGLAEYLQVPNGLPDALIRSYAHDLADIGVAGLQEAIVRLKRDPDLWSGRFPLPGKIRSYLTGTVDKLALSSANKILHVHSMSHARKTLSSIEWMIFMDYGCKAILERDRSQTPSIFSQLRELFKARYTTDILEGKGIAIEYKEIKVLPGEAGSQNLISEEGSGEGGELRPANELREDT